MDHRATPVYNICSLTTDGLEQQGVMVSRLSHYFGAHCQLHIPHRHSFYHLIVFTQGEGTCSIDFTEFPVSPNQVYAVVPGQVHALSVTEEAEGFVINFSKGFFYSFLLRPEYLEQFSFLAGAMEDSVINLPDKAMQQMTPVLEGLVQEGQQKGVHKTDMMRVLLLQLFLLIKRELVKKPNKKLTNKQSVIVRNFQNLVEHHYSRFRLPKDYAALLYVTPNHLNALCKENLGKPAGAIIRGRVLLEAKRMLTDANITISEIASRLSFNDNSYFTKFFKKYSALTPEEFREMNS